MATHNKTNLSCYNNLPTSLEKKVRDFLQLPSPSFLPFLNSLLSLSKTHLLVSPSPKQVDV
jgi:hypothetical protein